MDKATFVVLGALKIRLRTRFRGLLHATTITLRLMCHVSQLMTNCRHHIAQSLTKRSKRGWVLEMALNRGYASPICFESVDSKLPTKQRLQMFSGRSRFSTIFDTPNGLCCYFFIVYFVSKCNKIPL